MTFTIVQSLALVTKERRRQFCYLLVAITVMALLEAASIISILPFMAVLANPDLVQSNEYLSSAYRFIGAGSVDQFLLFLGGMSLAALVLVNTCSALTTWSIFRFNNLCGHDLSRRLLGLYLGQPYVFFLNRNSAELTKNIMVEVDRVVVGVIAPSMQVIAKSVVVASICAILFVVNPMLSLLLVMSFGFAYLIVYLIGRRRLRTSGRSSVAQGETRFRVASEAFGGIKELKVLRREQEYLRVYENPSLKFAQNVANSQAISHLPKYALETLAFGGVLIALLYLLVRGHELETILPTMSLIAFAGYRLAPAMQQIFHGLTTIRFHRAALDVLNADIHSVTDHSRILKSDDVPVTASMSFNDKVSLQGVSFSYPGSRLSHLQNVSLEIRKNTFIGIVGETGSGKSTLVDLVLGLVEPDRGAILVDGTKLDRTNIDRWQRSIGYVPQSIFLADDTVARNIAFGVSDSEIDRAQVERVARIAQLHEFIVSNLEDGYDTVVGERGTRLSGGERQRLGIARALYHDPQLLVLDEATSALDIATQEKVVREILCLRNRKTIIMIAHRLSTLALCDSMYRLEQGSVILLDRKTRDEQTASTAHVDENVDEPERTRHANNVSSYYRSGQRS